MLINFKSGILVSILIVTCSFVIAQTVTQKDVVLDGKPAKLNVNTGEVKLVKLKTINGKQVEIRQEPNSVINANLISNTSEKDKLKNTESKEIISQLVVRDTTKKTVFIKGGFEEHKAERDAKFLKLKEEATKTVYEIDASTSLTTSASNISDTSTMLSTREHNTNFHKVVKGETLYSLSKRYNTTLSELKRANNLETTLIRVGQNLRVGNFEVPNIDNTSGVWTVSKGDTLYNIAHRNNTTVDSIKSLNGLVSNLIKIGQKLQLR